MTESVSITLAALERDRGKLSRRVLEVQHKETWDYSEDPDQPGRPRSIGPAE